MTIARRCLSCRYDSFATLRSFRHFLEKVLPQPFLGHFRLELYLGLWLGLWLGLGLDGWLYEHSFHPAVFYTKGGGGGVPWDILLLSQSSGLPPPQRFPSSQEFLNHNANPLNIYTLEQN